MNSFEVAQIAYLRPESVDEAKTLIPRYARRDAPLTSSLERYQTDDEIRRLKDILDEVRTLMKYE